MNTVVTVLYRDASNYKQMAEVVFDGPPVEDEVEALMASLDGGEFLIPEQVGLPNPREQFGDISEDDHCWCEVHEVEPTFQTPTDPRTFSEFVAECVATEWDESQGMPEPDWTLPGIAMKATSPALVVGWLT